MKYNEALKFLRGLGCELMTKEAFLEHCRQEGEDVGALMFPYGCQNCGEALGEDDFTDIRYAILGDYDDRTWSLLREFWVVYGTVAYTVIARCKVCGMSDLYLEV